MSLINDALKRAKQVQQKNPPPAPATVTPLRPAGPVRRPPPASRGLLLPVGAAVLILIGGIAMLIAFKRGTRPAMVTSTVPQTVTSDAKVLPEPPGKAASTAVVVPPPTPSLEPAPTPVIISAPPIASNVPPVAISQPTIVTQTVIVVETPKPPPVVPVVAPSPPPVPKLQGILFNPARPTAFLGGKSVVVGARVGEFTVVAITKEAVTIERAGQTNVLKMEE